MSDLQKALDRFESWCNGKGLSPKTLYSGYLWHLRQFQKYVEATGIPWSDFTFHEIQVFLNLFWNRGIAPRTYNDMVRNIKIFYKFCFEMEMLPENPALKLPYKKFKIKLPPALTVDQVKLILSTVPPTDFYSCRTHTIITLLYDTCIRLNELRHIKFKDVDFKTRLIKITQPKEQRERLVPFGTESFRTLTKWIEKYRHKYLMAQLSDWLFCSTIGHQIDSRTLERTLQTIGKKLNLHLYPHLLRSSGITRYINLGGSLSDAQHLMGHADLRMLSSRYIRLTAKDLSEAHRKFSPADSLKTK